MTDLPTRAEQAAPELLEALKDCAHQAETRIKDGDEMGPRVWRIALVDILAECRAAIAKATGEQS